MADLAYLLVSFPSSSLVIIVNLIIILVLTHTRAKPSTKLFMIQVTLSNLIIGFLLIAKPMGITLDLDVTVPVCLTVLIILMSTWGSCITTMLYFYVDLHITMIKIHTTPVISKRRAFLMCGLSWCFWISFSSLGILWIDPVFTVTDGENKQCGMRNVAFSEQFLAFYFFLVLVNIVCLVVSHLLVQRLMEKTKQERSDTTTSTVLQQITKQQEQIRLLSLQVTITAVCWSIITIGLLILIFCDTCRQRFSRTNHTSLPALMFHLLFALPMCSNGVIYWILNESFRKSVNRFIRCGCAINRVFPSHGQEIEMHTISQSTWQLQ
jgi:hypothetical protein